MDTSKVYNRVADVTRRRAKLHGDRAAIWFEDEEINYRQLDERASQIANGLIGLGVQPGDRVAYLGKNSPSFFEVFFGAVKARAVMTGVNNRLAAKELEFVLNDCLSPILFVEKAFLPAILSIREQCTSLKTIILLDDETEEFQYYVAWRDALSLKDPDLDNAADDDIIQLYTSGTTGFPKGVCLTDDSYHAMFEGTFCFEWSSYNPGDSVLQAMPQFHVAGANLGVLIIAQGARVVMLREIDPAMIVRLIPEQKITHAFWAPAVILMITQYPDVENVDFSTLRYVTYGASPIAEDLLNAAIKLMNCKFTQLYGLTETNGCGAYLPPDAHDPSLNKLRSCGVPSPGAEIRIVDAEGKDLPASEVGEIIIKAPFIMKEYFRREEATKEAIRDGWFYTGDAGYKDEDGYLYIYDRVKDMIVSGGENVYPAEVENGIFGHPDVADVAVIGVPSDKWGEEVKAIVVVKPNTQPDADSIIAFARQNIAGYKVPKSVEFMDILPRNPAGKILRKNLREPYWAGVNRRVG